MRKNIIQFHVILAAFFLPIAIMFLVTGALYTVAIRGAYVETSREVTLTQPLEPELSAFVALVEKELGPLSPPTGSASLKGSGASASLDWTGANRDVSLQPTSNPLTYKLTVKDTTIHRRLVQLHKAKGSTFSKAVSIVWSVGLLAMFVSGFVLAWSVPNYRKTAIIATVTGLVTFLLYVFVG
jgi:hypothetical protein